MAKEKIRLSYTLLSAWLSGQHDRLANIYLHLDDLDSPAIRRGRKFDEYVCSMVDEYKMLPPELDNVPLNNPVTHHKITVDIDDATSLSGEIDVWDSPEIIEIKNSSVMDSGQFANSIQVSMYFYLLPEAEKATIYRYDETKREFDKAIIYRSNRRVAEIDSIVRENADQIREHLKFQGAI